MPRKARIDAPGALHHIIVRGIERRKIFYDEKDRNNLIKRLDAVLTKGVIGVKSFPLTNGPQNSSLLSNTDFQNTQYFWFPDNIC